MATSRARAELVVRAHFPELEPGRVTRVVEEAWERHGGAEGAVIEVVLLDGEEHARQHALLLGDPSPTDVMAIPYGDEDLHGEVLVNVDVARAEARARGVPPEREALLYVAHGVLHLLGFDDTGDEDRRRMRAAEAQLMACVTGAAS